jgi:hypothetical protein
VRKWTETRTALAKANAAFDPATTPTLASDSRSIGHKKAKSLRDATPAIEKLHSSIMACMADAATHTATWAEQAAQMDVVMAARWTSVI